MVLLKNVDLYTPKHVGLVDLLVENDQIVKIGKDIDVDCKKIDCSGKIIFPQYVDGHEHILMDDAFSINVIEESCVGTIVGVLDNEKEIDLTKEMINMTNFINSHSSVKAYCLAGSKKCNYNSTDFITENKNVVGIKTALYSDAMPNNYLSYEKLKSDAIRTYEAGKKTNKNVQVHIHLDNPGLVKEERLTFEGILSGKYDNLNWIDKIVEETGVPYSLFKLTHVHKFFDRIFEYANKGCYIDYTVINDEYDKRFGSLIKGILDNKVDKTKISMSTDLGVLNLEYGGNSFENPNRLHRRLKELVAKGLKIETVLPFITTNALAPIEKKEEFIFEKSPCKFILLDEELNILKVVKNEKDIIDYNKKTVVKTLQ